MWVDQCVSFSSRVGDGGLIKRFGRRVGPRLEENIYLPFLSHVLLRWQRTKNTVTRNLRRRNPFFSVCCKSAEDRIFTIGLLLSTSAAAGNTQLPSFELMMVWVWGPES